MSMAWRGVRGNRSPLILGGATIAALGLGLSISRLGDLASLGLLAAGLIAFSAVLLLPGAYLFFVAVIGNSAFGLVDLTVETRFGVIALDGLLICVSAALVVRAFLVTDVMRIQLKTGDPRFWFVLGILGVIALWFLVTLAKFEQSPTMTLKAMRSSLFYVFGLWGLIVTLDERGVRSSVRGLALGGGLVSCVVLVGTVVDLEPFLPGIPRVSSYSLEASFFRTVPWGYEFVYLAFFLFLFCEDSFPRWYRFGGVIVTALGVVALAFRAYWIGIVAALAVLYLTPHLRTRFSGGMMRRGLGVGLVIAVVLGLTGATEIVLRRVELVGEDLATGHGSVAIRVDQVKALMPLVLDDPFLGVGFLHGDGPYSSRIAPLQGLLINRFGTTDVGWMDILIRFGMVGSAVIVVLYVRLFRSLGESDVSGRRGLATSIRAMILMGVFALPGAALFSIPNGILCIVLPCGILIGSSGANAGARQSGAATTNWAR